MLCKMRSLSLLSLATSVSPALADTHYFFSGFFAGSTIVGVVFDDSASSLTIVNNITTDASSGSKWISLDVSAASTRSEIHVHKFEVTKAEPVCWNDGLFSELRPHE